jgi:5-methylcytosine-specific restriction enzyme subunit McrC
LPYSLVGDWHGISLLFPMEKLFERFVASALRRRLATGARMVTQAAREYLCAHDGGAMFRLEPDLLIEHAGCRWVLDTKWKRLDVGDKLNKYGLSQADFYQLYAYGAKYLGKQGGQMALIFPYRQKFQQSLPPFDFGNDLKLWVLPFDLDKEDLVDAGKIALPLVPRWT